MNEGSSIIGVDLGGTKVTLALFDADTKRVQAEKTVQTHAKELFKHVFQDLITEINDMKTPETIGIGIGVPGLVEQPEGVIVTLPNIPGAEGFPLKETVEEACGLSVYLDNDANCFTLAEARSGVGKGHSVVVGVTLGTGVGGGIIVDGNIFHGERGFAAEIGHMLLMPGNPPVDDPSQTRGDIEQFFSGTAIGKRCTQASDPEEYLEGETCQFLHADIEKEIAWMCVNLTHLLDPGIIIFGGSAGRALEPHIKNILVKLKEWLLPGTPLPEVAIAELPNSATLGAALLVKES